MNTHEPRHEFVDRLRAEVGHRVRARQRVPAASLHTPWLWRSRWAVAASLAGVVLVSMVIGGAVVAAAYQSQTNERRQLIAATYEQQVDLARMKLNVAKAEAADMRKRFQVGVVPPEELHEAEARVREAEVEVQTAMLNLDEVRVTGQEPLNAITAPLVNGRDFVLLRLESSLQAPAAVLELEKIRLQRSQRRVQVGVADDTEVLVISSRIAELEAAIRNLRQQITVRQKFIKGEFTALAADLQRILAEVEQKRQALQPQLELAQRSLQRTKSLFEKGLVTQSEVAKAQLRVLELTTEISKLDLELTLIREKLRGK